MVSKRKHTRRNVAVSGSWQPVPLTFLRSRACAELSLHAAKLLLDCLAMLGPNAIRNGDISLAPKIMAVRGWTSRKTLGDAVKELETAKLLLKTRQGSRLDCNLFALTIYPLDCDLHKLDVRPGCYNTSDWTLVKEDGDRKPTESAPARWNRVRKAKTDDSPRNISREKRSAVEQKEDDPIMQNGDFVPPGHEIPRFLFTDGSATGHLSRETICSCI